MSDRMVYILKYISIAYLIIFVLFSVFQSKINTSKTQKKILYILFALSLSVIAYNMSPPQGWDFVRHSEYMDKVRQSGISFSNFIFGHSAHPWGKGYEDLLTFNFLIYIVVKITNNNYLLPAICAFTCYAIVGYIAIDWQRTSEIYNSRVNALPLLLCFSFLEYIHVVSGMRNALCACVMSLAIYLYLFKKKKLYIFIVLAFLAATIHPAAIITVPFVFISRLNLGWWGYMAVFVVSILAKAVAELMSNSSILYFRIVGHKYFSYTSENQYRSSRTPLYTVLLLIIIFLFIYFFIHFRRKTDIEDNNRKLIYNFLSVYMVYIIGNIGNYDMVLRPAYVLGPLSPILCSLIYDDSLWMHSKLEPRNQRIIRESSIIFCHVLCLFMQYKLMTWYLPYFI